MFQVANDANIRIALADIISAHSPSALKFPTCEEKKNDSRVLHILDVSRSTPDNPSVPIGSILDSLVSCTSGAHHRPGTVHTVSNKPWCAL